MKACLPASHACWVGAASLQLDPRLSNILRTMYALQSVRDPRMPGPSSISGTGVERERLVKGTGPSYGAQTPPHGSCRCDRAIVQSYDVFLLVHPKGLAVAGLDRQVCFTLRWSPSSRRFMCQPSMNGAAPRQRLQPTCSAGSRKPLPALSVQRHGSTRTTGHPIQGPGLEARRGRAHGCPEG